MNKTYQTCNGVPNFKSEPKSLTIESDFHKQWDSTQNQVQVPSLSTASLLLANAQKCKTNENVQIMYERSDMKVTKNNLHRSQSACPMSQSLTLNSKSSTGKLESKSQKNGTWVWLKY